jgi:hypothetical protein
MTFRDGHAAPGLRELARYREAGDAGADDDDVDDVESVHAVSSMLLFRFCGKGQALGRVARSN